jgi:hypothetical protein
LHLLNGIFLLHIGRLRLFVKRRPGYHAKDHRNTAPFTVIGLVGGKVVHNHHPSGFQGGCQGVLDVGLEEAMDNLKEAGQRIRATQSLMRSQGMTDGENHRDLLTRLSTALAMTEAAYLEARRRRDL